MSAWKGEEGAERVEECKDPIVAQEKSRSGRRFDDVHQNVGLPAAPTPGARGGGQGREHVQDFVSGELLHRRLVSCFGGIEFASARAGAASSMI